MTYNGDLCPSCKTKALPAWDATGHETARACQQCGHVDERQPPPNGASGALANLVLDRLLRLTPSERENNIRALEERAAHIHPCEPQPITPEVM